MAPTSKEVSNSVPDDLAFSIFSKLPMKSLKRFLCVRKSWSNLFEDAQFMSMYRNNFISKYNSDNAISCLLLKQCSPRSAEHDNLLLLSGERFENRVKLDWPPPFQDDDSKIFISGSRSVNGILCVYHDAGSAPAPEIALKIVLWNPSIKKFKIIPSGTIECPLGFDISSHVCGFGYDHVTDDYKVIRYATFRDMSMDHRRRIPRALLQIYSKRSNTWRKLDNMDMIVDAPFSNNSVYLNGACHWLIDYEKVLVSFNMSNELVLETPLPLDGEDIFAYWDTLLVDLNGSIALISNLPETTTFDILILGELGVKESWTKLFTVGPLPCLHIPIGVGKKGGIFFAKCSKDHNELTWFDLNTQVIEETGVEGDALSCQIVSYKEILLPIVEVNV